jgi:hypothetical protein
MNGITYFDGNVIDKHASKLGIEKLFFPFVHF